MHESARRPSDVRSSIPKGPTVFSGTRLMRGPRP